MTDFDMPDASHSFEERGGWVLRRLMTDLAITENQAAGIVGNLGFESGGFKALQEASPLVSGSRGGYGWGQWTGPRRVAFETWCLAQKLAPSSDQANYGYLLVELHGPQAEALRRLKLTSSVGSAVFSFGFNFERPAGTTTTFLPGYDDRMAYARRALVGAAAVNINVNSPTTPSPSIADLVRPLQQALASGGYYRGLIDGDFGPLSYAAIRAAQA